MLSAHVRKGSSLSDNFFHSTQASPLCSSSKSITCDPPAKLLTAMIGLKMVELAEMVGDTSEILKVDPVVTRDRETLSERGIGTGVVPRVSDLGLRAEERTIEHLAPKWLNRTPLGKAVSGGASGLSV